MEEQVQPQRQQLPRPGGGIAIGGGLLPINRSAWRPPFSRQAGIADAMIRNAAALKDRDNWMMQSSSGMGGFLPNIKIQESRPVAVSASRINGDGPSSGVLKMKQAALKRQEQMQRQRNRSRLPPSSPFRSESSQSIPVMRIANLGPSNALNYSIPVAPPNIFDAAFGGPQAPRQNLFADAFKKKQPDMLPKAATPPRASTPVRVSTPPRASTPVRVSTPPRASTPVRLAPSPISSQVRRLAPSPSSSHVSSQILPSGQLDPVQLASPTIPDIVLNYGNLDPNNKVDRQYITLIDKQGDRLRQTLGNHLSNHRQIHNALSKRYNTTEGRGKTAWAAQLVKQNRLFRQKTALIVQNAQNSLENYRNRRTK